MWAVAVGRERRGRMPDPFHRVMKGKCPENVTTIRFLSLQNITHKPALADISHGVIAAALGMTFPQYQSEYLLLTMVTAVHDHQKSLFLKISI